MDSTNIKSTEFLFGVLVVLCATVLLAIDKIDEDSWKWAVTTVGGAYILSRGLVKGTANTATAKLADFKSSLAVLAATPEPEPAPPTTVTNVAVMADPGSVQVDPDAQDVAVPERPIRKRSR